MTDSLRGYPFFVVIKDEKYYWYRNINFKMEQISSWIEDVLIVRFSTHFYNKNL